MADSIDITTKAFSGIGGTFYTSAQEIAGKLASIKALVFDWDGVFNSGEKTSTSGSSFSEVDSMGLNLLRYAFFLKNGELPVTLIISGEKNESAFHYCERECLTYSFFKIAHKIHALDFLCEQEKITPKQVAYFFDDVLDVPIAAKCGVRIMVNQRSNPLFRQYCEANKLADYLTASPGGSFAVREATEMLTGLLGQYDEVIAGRTANAASYKEYLAQRRQVKPKFFTLKDSGIEAASRP